MSNIFGEHNWIMHLVLGTVLLCATAICGMLYGMGGLFLLPGAIFFLGEALIRYAAAYGQPEDLPEIGAPQK